jgi:hypothetical protein
MAQVKRMGTQRKPISLWTLVLVLILTAGCTVVVVPRVFMALHEYRQNRMNAVP